MASLGRKPRAPGKARRLGVLLEHGNGEERDLNEAARWHRLAADHNSADGQMRLGRRPEFGRGAAQNYGEAAK